MTHRTTEQDIGHFAFSPRDSADMEARFLLLSVEEIDKAYDRFTPEQVADLRLARDVIDAMILRGQQ